MLREAVYAVIIISMRKRVLVLLSLVCLLCASCRSLPETGKADSSAGETVASADQTEQGRNSPEQPAPPPEPVRRDEKKDEDPPRTGKTTKKNADQKPPLTDSELTLAVGSKMPWNMKAVHTSGGPLSIIHDLDKNGYDDFLVLAVEGDDETDASVANLSSSSRLFDTEKEYFSYFLLIFYQYNGEIILRYTVPVSKQLVFSGMSPFMVKSGSDFPYALQFSFKTRAGIEKEVVILSGYGITSFTLNENLSEFSHVEDIDEDGYIDIVIHEQGFEEGTGFETFLTWYKWNSREFAEYKNTNIVRNLRGFFDECSELLKDGNFEAFLEYALDSEALRALQRQKLTNSEIMERVFVCADNEGTEGDFFGPEGFISVIFPEIMETPFSYDSRNEFRHGFSVRFARAGGESLICSAELRMLKNPFGEKQFCLCAGATGDKIE